MTKKYIDAHAREPRCCALGAPPAPSRQHPSRTLRFAPGLRDDFATASGRGGASCAIIGGSQGIRYIPIFFGYTC